MTEGWKIDPRSATPPIMLDAQQAAEHRFCFMGEFGYEMISWLPYLRFLKQKLGIPLRTMGRVGSSLFYNFSDDHIELTNPPGDCWGELALYQKIAAANPGEKLVHPGPEFVNRRTIVIGGYDWRNRDIHARIDTMHYERLDYSNIAPALDRDRPIAVINNKYFVQWKDLFSTPVNFFDRDSLIELRDLLIERGYDVIYNHYVEKTAHDNHEAIDDEDIFTDHRNASDLRREYSLCADARQRNLLQLGIYNSADLVIGPQGGNLYVPAICRRNLYILMRVGNYIDYCELGKLYDVNVETFYEPRHLTCWLENKLPSAQTSLREAA
ncbi:MAG TPA: hypothetical protein VHD56_11110 [Tepidisphaeraceae bacterium]|nr:hypothetical protein [Tepidisphaeraceae bacterium]